MKKFDLEDYVTSNLDRTKLGSTGQYSATCPWCGKFGSFYIDSKTGNYICFKCGEKGYYLIGIISKIENISWSEAKSYLLKNFLETRRKGSISDLVEKISDLRNGEVPKEEKKIIELPNEFIPVYQNGKWKYPVYLKERKIKKETARIWNIGFCNSGRYKNRVIIPISCPNGKSFTARDVTGFLKPKYLNPFCSFQSHLLLGWEHISQKNDLTIVEGPIDAIKMWQHGLQAVALSGKVLHSKQIDLLSTLPATISIIVMLDPEEKKAPYDVARQLLFRFNKVFIAKLPDGVDPGSASLEQAQEAYEFSKLYDGNILNKLKNDLRSL
jgi:DNA primase